MASRLLRQRGFIFYWGTAMGAWGVGPLDNDAALDMLHLWKHFHTGGHPEGSYTPEGTMDYFLRGSLGRTIDWGDADTTARLIALAALYHRDGLAIEGKVREYFEEAINWELRRDALKEWDRPGERKRALEALLSSIGGKRRRISKSKLFRHPALEFRSQAELLPKLEGWVRGIKAHRLSQFPSDDEFPRFWHVLDRLMNSQVSYANDDIRLESAGQRLMLLAAYIGIYGRLPEEETIALIHHVKGRYAIFAHHTDTWQRYRVTPPPATRNPADGTPADDSTTLPTA